MKLTVMKPIFLYIHLKQTNGENATPQFVYHVVKNTVCIIISEEEGIALFWGVFWGGRDYVINEEQRKTIYHMQRWMGFKIQR